MPRYLPSTFYYYGHREHAEAFVERGMLSFGPSNFYENEALTAAQRDREHRRSARLAGPGLRVQTGPDPTRLQDVPDVRSVELDVRLPLYFIRSFTTRADTSFFTEFGGTCVKITDGVSLLRRASQAIERAQLPLSWRLVADVVHYQARSDPLPTDVDSLFFVKDATYAYQDELRFVLVPEFNYMPASPTARVELILGSLSDICVLSSGS